MTTDSTYSKMERSRVNPWPVAVIDIGATSLRMQIAEIHPDRSVKTLEAFEQAVSLGKDSFIKGRIDKSTIEDCVHVLRIYRKKLNEYGITDARQIRVIATSGVKEAGNRLAFQDRVYIATGFEIEPFDEAELHRVTYLGISPFIEKYQERFENQTMVCEVGGGTTEFILLEKDQVIFARTYRLGSLRLRKTLEAFDAPLVKSRQLMELQIKQTIQQLVEQANCSEPENLVAMGRDMRFAARELNGEKKSEDFVEVDLKRLESLTHEILQQTTDQLATRFHLSLPDADSLGPALLTNCLIARELGVKNVLVAEVNLRDGLVKEMAEGRNWSEAIRNQILQSAIQLGRKFHFDELHALHVSKIACSLFDQLRQLHELDDRFRGILQLASLLYEVGRYVSDQSYHKHTLYLIRHSEFFGIGAKDVDLVGLVARYHRRAAPQPRHDGYSSLNRANRVAVAKLAAILRISIALDATRTQRIQEIQCTTVGNQTNVVLPNLADISLERLEMKRNGSSLFADIFGSKVILRTNG